MTTKISTGTTSVQGSTTSAVAMSITINEGTFELKGVPPGTALADYLSRAAKHPEFASRALLARVKFLEGEEASAA